MTDINLLKDKSLEKVSWLKEILRNNKVNNLEDKGVFNLITVCDQFSVEYDAYICINRSYVYALRKCSVIK